VNPYNPNMGGYPQQAPAQGPYGRLEVNTSFFPLQWGLFFKSPRIEINGQVNIRGWGRSAFDLPAGQYALRVFVPYFFMSQACLASCPVVVYAGHTTYVNYNAPFFVLLSGGNMNQVGTQPMQQLGPAGPR
jgi:hypothetical protein